MNFVHLHTHTDASLRDGLGQVSRTVLAAKRQGFDMLAITDHGSLANTISFSIECRRNDIKPILGLEGYIAVDGVIGHVTLLADGNEGWQNLVKLNNLAHQSEYKSPAFTPDQLVAHAKGLVLLTGCVASPLHSLPPKEAVSLGAMLKSAFGARMFVEVMFVADLPTWERSYLLAEKLGLGLVVSNDVHFATQNDADLHPILTAMKAGYTYNSRDLWLKNPDQLWARAKVGDSTLTKEKFGEWIVRSKAIAKKLGEVKLAREPRLPEVAAADETLQSMVFKGLAKILSADDFEGDFDPYIERAKYELEVIRRMDYSTYFLILDDILSWARDNGVRIGAGRGSGAGSLVLYAIGITDVDPIKHGLQFERFLNPERKGMPDVDVDIESERREMVLNYAHSKYGAVPIATYARYSHKSLVHDLAKQFRVPKAIENKAAELGPESPDFKRITEEFPGFEEAYDAFLGQIRHKGKHAGGVIITDQLVPIERAGRDELVAAWSEGSHNELSFAGIVKFDLLGLSALSVLRRLENKFATKAKSPEDDPNVFKVFKSGDLAGIFQFSGSPGIRDLTMKLQPDVFEDLVAINALFRPGALDAGTAMLYPEFKKTPREVPTAFQETLASTYGVVVFQEQMMTIIQIALGGSLGEADLARRIITKGGKKLDDAPELKAKFDALKEAFIQGCVDRLSMRKAEAKEWWGELETHGRYSFNKSHSTAYSMIAWEMAWWKFYHTADFYAELLNVDSAQAQTYIASALDAGIEIAMPDVNHSGAEWTAKDRTRIYMPLTAVKYLGLPGVQSIINGRRKGEYVTIEDFMSRNPKKIVRGQARQGLWYLGAMRGLEGSFRDLQLGRETVEKYMSPVSAQRKFLGFIIPPVRIAKMMLEYREKGWVCGIIESKKQKESRWGEYMVYYLSPTGIFWSRERMDLEVGTIVAAKPTAHGKAERIEVLLA